MNCTVYNFQLFDPVPRLDLTTERHFLNWENTEVFLSTDL